MSDVEIKHQLDLIVRLIDTTTGMSISERNVCFKRRNEIVRFVYKGGGIYILIDSGKEDANYDVQVFGYEDTTICVEYGESEKRIQNLEVSLVPKETKYSYSEILTMSGQLKGLEELSAVRLSRFDRIFTEYDVRRGTLKYYGGPEVSEKEYALLNKSTMTYEIFQVKKAINATTVSIMEPLQMPYEVKNPITRVVKGKIGPDHNYILRIRDDGQKCVYLVRYKVNGNTYFKKVDFKNEEERSLE